MLCQIPYDAADPESAAGQCQDLFGSPCPVQLLGDLVAGSTTVNGSGSFLLGLAPMIYTQASWTALK